jgi:hypothetical protein
MMVMVVVMMVVMVMMMVVMAEAKANDRIGVMMMVVVMMVRPNDNDLSDLHTLGGLAPKPRVVGLECGKRIRHRVQQVPIAGRGAGLHRRRRSGIGAADSRQSGGRS